MNTWMAGKKIGNPFYELINQRTPKNPRKTSKGIDPIVSDIDPAGMSLQEPFTGIDDMNSTEAWKLSSLLIWRENKKIL